MEFITKSSEETFNLGVKIGKDLSNSRGERLLCLYGDLGSGKTTFVQGVAKSLGINQLIPSPTFIIVRQYNITNKNYSLFYHIDLYRLEKIQEIATLGLNEIFTDSRNFIAIEWAEKLGKLIPEERIDVKFTYLSDNTRKIIVGDDKLDDFSKEEDTNSLVEAVKIIKQGGIVIFPTDTAFGVGCRLDNPKSIARLFKIKKRPKVKATPVLVSSIQMAQDYFAVPLPDIVRRLMNEYWPGAVTIVYKANLQNTPLLVRGGTETIGLRLPNHLTIRKLIENVGVPILGPSANFHGMPTPYRFADLDPDLKKLVDYIVPGKCSFGKISTVINCVDIPCKILRQGAQIIDNKYLKV